MLLVVMSLDQEIVAPLCCTMHYQMSFPEYSDAICDEYFP
jgi:hypothetical protein